MEGRPVHSVEELNVLPMKRARDHVQSAGCLDSCADDDQTASRRSLRVVIVDEELPYPADSGKRIRTLHLILPLARRHRLTYICHPSADLDETRQAVEFFRGEQIETVLVDRPLPRKGGPAFYARLARNLLSPLPYSVQVHNTAALRHAIRSYAATHRVDLWHCEWTPYGESLAPNVSAPWIAMAHNVESLIWQRYGETETNPLKRWYIKRQWTKFERFERRIFAAAARVVAVSDNDARLMQDRYHASRVDVVDNGVDVTRFAPDGSPRDPNQLLFLGSLDWRPNLDAVEILLAHIFPQVVREMPSARLVLVGRHPPVSLLSRVRSCRNVEIHADVPDVRPYLRRSALMVVPLRIGGGSRLKILESLAAECPVVSTRIGAEGLCLVPDRHFVQVESVDEMADAVVRNLRNPEPIVQMARRGRESVAERYDWPILSAKLEQLWRDHSQPSGRRAEQ